MSDLDEMQKRMMEQLRQEYLKGKGAKPTTEPDVPKTPPKYFDDAWERNTGTTELIEWVTYKEFTRGAADQPKEITETVLLKRFKPEYWEAAVQGNLIEPNDTYVYTDRDFYLFTGLDVGLNVFVHGPAGAGKDEGCRQYAALAGMPFWRTTGMEGVVPDMVIGRKSLIDGNTGWEDGDAAIHTRYGGLHVISEPAAMPPATMFAFQPVLEHGGHLNLMDHPDPTQRMLHRHQYALFALTSNVRGVGDNIDKYAATGVMDSSTKNRMDMELGYEYLKPEQEISMLMKKFDGITEELAGKVVKMGNLLRQAWNKGEIEAEWSPRSMFALVNMALIYKNPGHAFKATFLDKMSDDERQAVKVMWRDVFDENI